MFTMGYVRVHARVYTWAYVRVRTVWRMGVHTHVDGNFIMPRTVCLRHVAKVSCNQLQLIIWFWYVYANKINSAIYTVHIPRRQLLPSPLKAHTCSHTQQSLDIHCDCTQEDSRHGPQNVSVHICSLYCKSLSSTWNAAKQALKYILKSYGHCVLMR